MNAVNRMFGPTLPGGAAAVEARKPRTPAQAEASRINGAKSRGPKTRMGKDRSRQNAVRHGFLARKVVPIADGRHEHREYRGLLDGLVAEFEPRTTTEWAWVETLAHDFVHLGRVKQLQEVVMTAEPMRDSCGTDAYTLDLRYRIGVLARLAGEVRDGRPMTCGPAELAGVGAAVRKLAESMREDARETREKVADGEEPEDQWVREAELSDRIDPDVLDEDVARVERVLAGGRAVLPEHRDSWAFLLDGVRLADEGREPYVIGDQARFDRKFRLHQATLLARLPSMEVLQRYESQFRKSVERTTRLLDERLQRRAR